AVPRPRPSDLFSSKTDVQLPQRSKAEVLTDIQRELVRRGFYDGPVDGVHGPKTDTAIRDFEQAAGLKASGEPNEDLLRAIQRSTAKATTSPTRSAGRGDPIGELIAPSTKRVLAVQRALAEFGYGQVKP